jgi:SAM-dependent methyltransferase
MFDYFKEQLQEIETKIGTTTQSEIPHLFDTIPIDVFASLLLAVPQAYPNIRAFLPSMPSDEVQRSWTGADSFTLMAQSLAFIKTLIPRYRAITGRDIGDATVLDFGCGWGRLTRLLYKYVPIENLYGVDPWESSLEECRKHGFRIHLAKSEEIPTALPFARKFDLIFAFSVLTHLSERTAGAVMKTLRAYIGDEGVLVITIRPVDYWHFMDREKVSPVLLQQHASRGFAFRPHGRAPIDGEVTFGDTSMSLEYIREHYPQWQIAWVDWTVNDSLQILVFLRPA